MKRFIEAPQLVLGLAFSFGIPMAFASYQHPFDSAFYLLFSINFLWVLIYDTVYAMSDREDDLKIGVKSTAIYFGEKDRLIVAVLQVVVVILCLCIMWLLHLDLSFLFAICLVSIMFGYQQWLIKDRQREACFGAFLNNAWVGAVLWLGLLSAY
jgi:4-hydroxybenzoate polyprenyltransferase